MVGDVNQGTKPVFQVYAIDANRYGLNIGPVTPLNGCQQSQTSCQDVLSGHRQISSSTARQAVPDTLPLERRRQNITSSHVTYRTSTTGAAAHGRCPTRP
jgi:hypothetical protein